MRGLTKGLFVVGLVAAAAVLWGCNEGLDDPTEAEGILSIEKIEPATVKAVVDPNAASYASDDNITISVKNRLRIAKPEDDLGFSDIYIQQSERTCYEAGAVISRGIGQGGVTVATGQTVAISTTAVSVADKHLPGVVNTSWQCEIILKGKDLAGNPATSAKAVFVVNFVP